jgi:hypothetical protein
VSVVNASRWMVRLGASLLLFSPFLPQCSLPSGGISPFMMVVEHLRAVGTPMEFLGLALWLAVPFLGGAGLLAGAWRSATPPTAVRGLTLALLLATAFALSTLGSILLTQTGAGPQAPTVSFPVALALFLLPLVLGGVALARLVGGEFALSSGGYTRLSLGLLLALNGLFLIDSGWDLLLAWVKLIGTSRAMAGAWIAPAAGLLVAAGEILARRRPRVVVDTVPASG